VAVISRNPIVAHEQRRSDVGSVEERNMELMQTLDDAWNAQDLETFAQRHKPDTVCAGRASRPRTALRRTSRRHWRSSGPSDQHLDNRPYKVFFASGDFCTVARWDDGQIVEEDLFYDLVTFMRQLGLSG
jgi:hypothetical protein